MTERFAVLNQGIFLQLYNFFTIKIFLENSECNTKKDYIKFWSRGK